MSEKPLSTVVQAAAGQIAAPWLTWLLAALTATMRVAWVYPWLLAVGAWMAPSHAQPILPLWSLYALLLGGRAAAQMAAAHTSSLRQARLWMAVLGPLVLLLLLWWLYGRPLPIWDVRWLQLATGSPELWAREVAPAVIAFFAAAWLWLRGVLDAGAPVDHEAIVGSFVTGSVAFAVLLVGSHLAGNSAAGAPLWLAIFVTAGMAALALASLERSLYAGGAATVTRLRLNRYWLGSVALVIAAVLLLGFVVSALIAPESIAQTLALLAPVVDALAQVLLAIVYVAVYVLFLVLTPLIEWLRALIAAQQAQETPADAAAMQPLSPLFLDQAVAAPAELVEPFRWGVIVAVVIAAAVIFALSLRFLRVPESSDVDETRESILSRSLLAEQLRALWARLRAQTGADNDAAFLALDGEAPTRRQIRARYQAFLAAMAARGQPRPPSTTPAAYAAQLNDLAPPQQAALHTLTTAYTAVRYGNASPTADEVPADEVDWSQMPRHAGGDDLRQ
jgi:hypothetical protein